jgi:SAM-dependent methyltransferase
MPTSNDHIGKGLMSHWSSIRRTKPFQAYRAIRAKTRRQIFGEPCLLDRVVLEQETKKLVDALPASKMDALEVSGERWKAYPFKSLRSADYPDYDICKKPLALESFDLVIAEQVFEHLLYPYRAAKNVYAMLRPGGYFLISTPFLQKIHNFPVDCSRWTPLGMKYFLSETGFPIDAIQSGSWGNRAAVEANLKAPHFPYYNPILHPMKNEEIFPVQVWALARKGT